MFDRDFLKIPLTQGFEATIDVEDHDRIIIHKWFAMKRVLPSGRKYVRAARWKRRGKLLYMQYEILDIEHTPGKEIDHIDGDPLNNRRSNLRVVSKMENMQRRVGYTWNTR